MMYLVSGYFEPVGTAAEVYGVSANLQTESRPCFVDHWKAFLSQLLSSKTLNFIQ